MGGFFLRKIGQNTKFLKFFSLHCCATGQIGKYNNCLAFLSSWNYYEKLFVYDVKIG